MRIFREFPPCLTRQRYITKKIPLVFANRNAKLVGYQILYGAGAGAVIQNTVSMPLFPSAACPEYSGRQLFWWRCSSLPFKPNITTMKQ